MLAADVDLQLLATFGTVLRLLGPQKDLHIITQPSRSAVLVSIDSCYFLSIQIDLLVLFSAENFTGVDISLLGSLQYLK